ncbi:2,3-bisphosphoglycerate-independent phosphoglycerate mutase [Wolbachia endosymbiont of Howardula sp.]|uniref:2,3-bisphosphoglycerate-independent phosphoglycerate mutase n=1 Tax=Wolbachia endosymbiont of Howardula sp. TaxID=2916816 RepID=UPI00217F0AB8|nr:2,3-bisphosphoglycerate-independent phosphoglycerate mutase [Wolbachia endosymbiont of Howardula sp.]UWI83134.1 2,3-bisphosphoglycerate-independent phosphoglycerate mutase [Wolbachia endosymbiont of Howardula sp.]
MHVKSIVLCILDGWGNGIMNNIYNPISSAYLPCWNYINSYYPKCNLLASGLAVGLPKNQIGNSEVGHMNIGSGRVLMQSLERINQKINIIDNNINLQRFIHNIKNKNGICHLLGLISSGGVHSHHKHIAILANKIAQHGIKVMIHAFLDGRDTPPNSGKEYLQDFIYQVKDQDIRIATISGRYYAMDRDNRWERTRKTYKAIVFAQGRSYKDVMLLLDSNYHNNIGDEFIHPSIIGDYNGIEEEDGILFANFRADRMMQLASMLLKKQDTRMYNNLTDLKTNILNKHANSLQFLSMTQYKKGLQMPYLFSPISCFNSLGQVISRNKLRQLRIAETEKYAHVTYFFNCGQEDPFLGEERILIASPKVKTYDLQPEMSVFELTKHLIIKIRSQEFSLIVVNFANPDMVGHTGKIIAAQKALEAVDICIKKVLNATQEVQDTALIVTSDHGNIECMFDEINNTSHTAHTLNTVPFIICYDAYHNMNLKDGKLSDIAPTILQLLKIPQPSEMTGMSLLMTDSII